MKELEAQAKKKHMSMSMSNTIVIASSSPRPRTPSPRTTAQSSQGQEETLNSSEVYSPTPMPTRSIALAQLYHSSRRSRHDSQQNKNKTSDHSLFHIDPLPLFELSACNDQEKIWKEMEVAISNTNADEWSFSSTFDHTSIRQRSCQ